MNAIRVCSLLLLVLGCAANARAGETLAAGCDNKQGCTQAHGLVKPNGKIRCVQASGSASGVKPACFVVCNPVCGMHTLSQGQEAAIPKGGKLDLSCNGNAAGDEVVKCSLAVVD
jgi:hypothetical protein